MSDIFERIREHAVRQMLAESEIGFQIWTEHADEHVGLIAGGDFPMPGTDKFETMHLLGSSMAEYINQGRVADLVAVTTVSEAWMVNVKTDDARAGYPDDLPAPSEHPDRIEVLVLSRFNLHTEQYQLKVYEIVRPTNRAEEVDLHDYDLGAGTEVKAPLIDAFVEGFNEYLQG